jgi:hypothetical protein
MISMPGQDTIVDKDRFLEKAHDLEIAMSLLQQAHQQFGKQYEKDQAQSKDFYREKFEEINQSQKELDLKLEKFISDYGKALQTLAIQADRWKTGLAIILALGAFGGAVIGFMDSFKTAIQGWLGHG